MCWCIVLYLKAEVSWGLASDAKSVRVLRGMKLWLEISMTYHKVKFGMVKIFLLFSWNMSPKVLMLVRFSKLLLGLAVFPYWNVGRVYFRVFLRAVLRYTRKFLSCLTLWASYPWPKMYVELVSQRAYESQNFNFWLWHMLKKNEIFKEGRHCENWILMFCNCVIGFYS